MLILQVDDNEFSDEDENLLRSQSMESSTDV